VARLLIRLQLPHVNKISRGVNELVGMLAMLLGRLQDGDGKVGVEWRVVEWFRRTLDALVRVVDLFLGEEGAY